MKDPREFLNKIAAVEIFTCPETYGLDEQQCGLFTDCRDCMKASLKTSRITKDIVWSIVKEVDMHPGYYGIDDKWYDAINKLEFKYE